MKRTFYIKTLWDDKANVYYSESDIDGLHIEADSIEEFEQIMHDSAIELIVENHMSDAEIAATPVKDLIPTILWQRPSEKMAVA